MILRIRLASQRLVTVLILCTVGLFGLLFGAQAVKAKSFAGKFAMLDADIPEWADPATIDQTLARLKASGFNVYMPTVWQGRGTAWPSKYAPMDAQLRTRQKPGFDVFKYLIDKAHALGIEVHPWFTLAFRQGNLFPEFAPPGTPPDAFDVHNEEFRRLIANLVGEVADHYDIDGINLDYVRTMGLCSSDSCKVEYSRRYGRSLSVDSALFTMTFGKATPVGEFQTSDVTQMVRLSVQAARRTKPGLFVSVDAIPLQAGPEQGQASIQWVNEGLIDSVFRMDYFPKINVAVTESIRAQLNNPDALTMLISNMSTEEELVSPDQPRFPRSGAWLASTTSAVQSRWPNTGMAVYFYKYLSDEQGAALVTGPFRQRLEAPERPIGITVQ